MLELVSSVLAVDTASGAELPPASFSEAGAADTLSLGPELGLALGADPSSGSLISGPWFTRLAPSLLAEELLSAAMLSPKLF